MNGRKTRRLFKNEKNAVETFKTQGKERHVVRRTATWNGFNRKNVCSRYGMNVYRGRNSLTVRADGSGDSAKISLWSKVLQRRDDGEHSCCYLLVWNPVPLCQRWQAQRHLSGPQRSMQRWSVISYAPVPYGSGGRVSVDHYHMAVEGQ